MALLLDTQMLIWIEHEPERISDTARERIARESLLFYSTVSIWELAIKLKTGKLSLPQPLPDFINKFQRGYVTLHLPIHFAHIYKTQELPLHHRDPFDRLLIAQSIVENIPVVSSDTI